MLVFCLTFTCVSYNYNIYTKNKDTNTYTLINILPLCVSSYWWMSHWKVYFNTVIPVMLVSILYYAEVTKQQAYKYSQ